MRQKSSGFQRKGKPGGEKRRLLPVVVIPLIVLILMAVIVFADRKKEQDSAAEVQQGKVRMADEADGRGADDQNADDQSGENQNTDDQSGESQNTDNQSGENQTADDQNQSEDGQDSDGEGDAAGEGAEDESGAQEEQLANPLRQDSDPEILSLMKTYFAARATADAETMNRLYGVGEVGVVTLEQQKTRMRSNSKYVQGFENITTYVKDGMTADSWLVYAVSDIRFHAVKTAAPMIMWCYVTKDAEGNYRIADNAALTPEILQYVDTESRSEEVRRLASSVNVALKEALTSDADLNEVYGVLREGSPVWEGRETEETEAVQILDGEAEAEAGAADGATEQAADGADGQVVDGGDGQAAGGADGQAAGGEDGQAAGGADDQPAGTADGTANAAGVTAAGQESVEPGDVCTDDFSGESTVLDDGSAQ